MDLSKFIRDFEESLEDVAEGTLTGGTVYRELKSWDSLAVLTVTDTIEMEYDVLLKKSDFAEAKTIQDLYDLVASKQ